MTALALLLAGLSFAADPADPKGLLQFNSGLRPLGLPLDAALGGGLRVGPVIGPVTPFVGGNASFLHVSQDDDEGTTTLSAFSAQLGAKLRVARLEAADTHVIAGALISDVGGRSIWDPRLRRGASTRFQVLPGAFAGGGVDAWVGRGVTVGVEAGLGYGTATAVSAEILAGNTVDGEAWPGNTGLFTWTTLDATLWFGVNR